MTQYATRPRSSARPVLVAAVIIAAVLAAGTAGALYWLSQGGGTAATAPPRAADVAQRAGCAGFAIEATGEMYVREAGRCTIAGQAVRVKVFADGEQRDNYLRAAQAYGGAYVVGDRYLIGTESVDLAEQLADRLGASVA